MSETLSQGSIRIADDVVAVIAGLAATKTKGIASMSGGITEGWAKRVSGKNVTRGVSVEVGQLETAIDLRVIVEYGVKINEVARELQHNVKEAVETMTGLRVVEVNVKVEGVDVKEKEDEQEDRVR
ncbi:Asp23/Gls24 family envelope stress response protein [Polycladomyces subterraneus]|uniref:Asp23/Gls24 family envelope stress response protein n=1 Tax=Polycladomyces subterraneus TaxID=1016997 RepID=A0ABT8IS76_9BACL|nr:Asp23/Gls24 family envelope stress response protein [Polycladomyces subterraneus]MDN4595306.1 Asp23/Gls24 family envelope stress response protein [Polycladomyces subterraneus]